MRIILEPEGCEQQCGPLIGFKSCRLFTFFFGLFSLHSWRSSQTSCDLFFSTHLICWVEVLSPANSFSNSDNEAGGDGSNEHVPLCSDHFSSELFDQFMELGDHLFPIGDSQDDFLRKFRNHNRFLLCRQFFPNFWGFRGKGFCPGRLLRFDLLIAP